MFTCGPAFFASIVAAVGAALKFNFASNSQYIPVMTGIGSI